MNAKNQVPILEFRRLLYAIKDLGPDIGVRVRLMGEMWQPRHLHVLKLTEKGVALHDPESKKLIMVPDLSQVMQFDLDHSFQQYEPHHHYSVDPALVNY